jgi:hypothetical protein
MSMRALDASPFLFFNGEVAPMPLMMKVRDDGAYGGARTLRNPARGGENLPGEKSRTASACAAGIPGIERSRMLIGAERRDGHLPAFAADDLPGTDPVAAWLGRKFRMIESRTNTVLIAAASVRFYQPTEGSSHDDR